MPWNGALLTPGAGRLSVRRSAGIVKTKGERLIVGPTKNGGQRVVILMQRRWMRCVATAAGGLALIFGWSVTTH